jgi:hypothetical protein
MTTTGSQANGFRIPSAPGWYEAKVESKKGAVTYETSFPNIEVIP